MTSDELPDFWKALDPDGTLEREEAERIAREDAAVTQINDKLLVWLCGGQAMVDAVIRGASILNPHCEPTDDEYWAYVTPRRPWEFLMWCRSIIFWGCYDPNEEYPGLRLNGWQELEDTLRSRCRRYAPEHFDWQDCDVYTCCLLDADPLLGAAVKERVRERVSLYNKGLAPNL